MSSESTRVRKEEEPQVDPTSTLNMEHGRWNGVLIQGVALKNTLA